MIIGVGIDIVRVPRFKEWLDRPGLMERYFHPAEAIRAAGAAYGGTLSLAARFAAKEAFGKALGTGLRGFSLREVQVTNNDQGRPYLVLHGKALDCLRSVGGARVHVSLTHEDDNAVAMVVIEG